MLTVGDKAAKQGSRRWVVPRRGMRGINAGALANAAIAEGLTAMLLGIQHPPKITGRAFAIPACRKISGEWSVVW